MKALFNFYRDNRRIYMQKINHPFWESYQNYPPVRYTSRRLARLCHFCNQVPSNNNKPFIIDYEHVLMMSGNSIDYTYMVKSARKIEDQLNNEKCKAIFVPSQGAIRETSKYIDISKILNKTHIVRPAYPTQTKNPRNHQGPFTILTIGNKFWGKGIPIAIEVFRVLREKYGNEVKMHLVSGDIPKDYPLPKGVRLINVPMLSNNLRSKLYNNAHISLFPCLHDSFAVYQESMAYGVPMIATRIYDKDELILEGETGYLVETPISLYDGAFGIEWKSWGHFQEIVKTKFENGCFSEMIDKIVTKIELLINNIDLVRNMGLAAQRLQREQYSVEYRNQKVEKLYNNISIRLNQSFD